MVQPGPQRVSLRIPYPMMYGMKKSDEAVLVPLKAANKGAQAPAESPEGRASTKGNSRDQSTHRTQGRDGMSQAVKRIRQAATRAVCRQPPKVGAVCVNAESAMRTYGSERGDRGNPVPNLPRPR